MSGIVRRTVDVVGVGANSVDSVSVLPALPQPHGEHAKMRVLERTVRCGGQTATALVTCARHGLRAKYVGTVGNDAHGQRMREALAGYGVDVGDVVVRDAPNRHATILVTRPSGERIVLWDRDARLDLRTDELPVDVITTTHLLHVDDEEPCASLAAASLARAAGVMVTSDLDRLTEHTDELVHLVTVPIFAEPLLAAFTGEADPERALRALRRRHPGWLVVTLGAGGALALAGDRLVAVPAYRVEVVDTTGAGDVFRGGFIYGVLQGWPVERVLQWANAAAAASCTRLGAFDGAPSLEETQRVADGAAGAGLSARAPSA